MTHALKAWLAQGVGSLLANRDSAALVLDRDELQIALRQGRQAKPAQP